jgi:hypothetical protein
VGKDTFLHRKKWAFENWKGCVLAPLRSIRRLMWWQYVSKINKQNFDLKLELFHRRQRAEGLEAQLRKMTALEEENDELQKINEDLLRELEKRDLAIKEAVNIVCVLEEKIENLEARRTTENSAISSPKAGHSPRSSCVEPLSAPEPRSRETGKHLSHPPLPSAASSPSKSLGRQPPFLRELNGSSSALRSLYQAGANVSQDTFSPVPLPRPMSVLSRTDDGEGASGDIYSLKAPSLSVLSESSFLSIYGKARAPESSPAGRNSSAADKQELDEDDPIALQRLQRAQSRRINNWMDGKDSPSRQKNSPAKHDRPEPILSIDQALGTPSALAPIPGRKLRNDSSEPQKPEATDEPWPHFSGFASYGHDPLPPTPDTLITASTSVVNSSTHSIIAEKSRIDSPRKGYSGLTFHPPPFGVDDSRGQGVVSSDAAQGDPDSSEDESAMSMKGELDGHYGLSNPGSATLQAMRNLGGDLARAPASLTPYGMNLMFNGDDHLPSSLSNLETRDSPAEMAYRRRSTQPLPREAATSTNPDENMSPLTSQEWRVASNQSPTPPPSKSKAVTKDPPAPSHKRAVTQPSCPPNLKDPPTSESRSPRTTNFRAPSMIATVQPTDSSGSRATLTNRFFRRSSATTPRTTSYASSARIPTSHHPQSRSNHMARSSSFSSNHPPILERPTQAPLSRIARPSTSGSLESRQSRRPASAYFAQSPPGFFGATTGATGGEAAIGTVTAGEDEGAREGKKAGRQDPTDVGERAESRHDGSGSRKWGRGIGRIGSLKLRQWRRGGLEG